MADCICVIKEGERFAHGKCLAFHQQRAVGYVTDPVTLTVERGHPLGPQVPDRLNKANALLDEIEQTFIACRHPFLTPMGWCNLCGAMRLGNGEFLRPHWRDLLLAALLSMAERNEEP